MGHSKYKANMLQSKSATMDRPNIQNIIIHKIQKFKIQNIYFIYFIKIKSLLFSTFDKLRSFN